MYIGGKGKGNYRAGIENGRNSGWRLSPNRRPKIREESAASFNGLGIVLLLILAHGLQKFTTYTCRIYLNLYTSNKYFVF